MEQSNPLWFTATFPTFSRAICRLTVRFSAFSHCGHHELALRARKLLEEAALGRGGDSVVDFRIVNLHVAGTRRDGGRWCVATGILAVTSRRMEIGCSP